MVFFMLSDENYSKIINETKKNNINLIDIARLIPCHEK